MTAEHKKQLDELHQRSARSHELVELLEKVCRLYDALERPERIHIEDATLIVACGGDDFHVNDVVLTGDAIQAVRFAMRQFADRVRQELSDVVTPMTIPREEHS